MLCGADGIDVDDWEKHTEPLGKLGRQVIFMESQWLIVWGAPCLNNRLL